jgi:hypothetical protein
MIDTFKASLDAYRDKTHGLLGDSIAPEHPSGNALLYESHAAIIARDLGDNIWLPFYKAADLLKKETKEGLFRRKPIPADDFNTHDDYVGVAAYSPSEARKIHRYGYMNSWVYDHRYPGMGWWKALFTGHIDAWHARFPGLIEHYLISSNNEPSIKGWVAWYLSIWWTTRNKGNESGWLLDYLKVRSAARLFPKSFFVKSAVSRYVKQLEKHYGGNIKNVYSVYFGATHPFASYSHWPR